MNFNISEKTAEILKDNDLDFEILKMPTAIVKGSYQLDGDLNMTLGDDAKLVMSPYFNLVNGKSNEILHTVKGGYRVSQNDEVVEKVLRGIEPFGDKLSVNKAGSLNGGRRVYIQLAIEGDAHINGDTIKRYVTIIDSNDGSTGLSVGVGNMTMSCTNQFFQFYKGGQRFKHTASIDEQIKKLPSMIELSLGDSMKQIELFKRFESSKCSRDLAHGLVRELLGVDRKMSQAELGEASTRKINSMHELYAQIETEMNSKGANLWGLFSGATRWTTHHKSCPSKENGRIDSLMNGTNYRTNQQALAYVDSLEGSLTL